MLIAHVCPCCGTQLARKRAEFAYGLHIVRCTCGYACVRRRHPLIARWGSGCLAARAWTFLVVQIVLAAVFTLASAGFIAAIQKELRDLGVAPWALPRALAGHGPKGKALSIWFHHDAGYILLIIVPVFLVFVGAWLRASMGRWPFPVLVWALGVSLWLWHELLLYPLRFVLNVGPYTGPTARDSGEQAFLLAVAFIIVFCSAPIGRGLESLFRMSRRQRFIKQLRKRRAARKGQ